MAPVSGGQYHWVSMLAPPSCSNFLSYITGWVTVCGWQASTAGCAYFSGTMLQGLIVLTNPDYKPERWQGTLIIWACLVFAVSVNVGVNWLLPRFENAVLMLHVVGFFAVLIPLVVLGPHEPASDVFGTWLNEGDWSTQSLSFFVGILGDAFAFLGKFNLLHSSYYL